ncbi:A/G-specific adenine glycosylase [Candidatus Kaiserbacteria bacterium]|nr:A/G-specific adenine glycosylase [Candidatus Kaiserbacteria bacterium]
MSRVPHVRATAAFRRVVWRYWKENGRHDLPWRRTTDPYRILVSEVMLQQTQVPRVIEKYKEFLRMFPSARVLARADLAQVLRVWSGLGYNRRAKFLHEAARVIQARHGGAVPREYDALCALPGIGEYTAKAVRVFAFNEQDVLLETNVRTAVIHHFFAGMQHIHDRDVIARAVAAAKRQDPRQWHSALFDYGVHLKATHGNASRTSAHYKKQSKFDGSLRQVRGAVLKALAAGGTLSTVRARFPARYERALQALYEERIICKRGARWMLSS